MSAESAKHFLHRKSKVLVTRSKSSNTEMFVMASVFTLEDALKIVVGTVRTEPRANVISIRKKSHCEFIKIEFIRLCHQRHAM